VEKPETAVALCAVGAEKAVSNELRKMKLPVLDSGFGRVRFSAHVDGLYRALMGLRAADRVLLEAGFFQADNFDALFAGAQAVPWERLVPPDMGLAVVKVRSNRSQLKAETSIQSVVHKAAAERLCKSRKIIRLPEGGKAAELRVYVEKDRVSLLVDLSGEPLFKRGYRSEGGIAPLRETTAAALLLLSGWKRKFPLYDPFCGSGTLLIEAAMYAWDMAPGLGRRYAIEDLLIADRRIEAAVRDELTSRVNFDRRIRIAGSDDNARAVSIAASNAARAFDLARGMPALRGIRPALAGDNPALPHVRVLPMQAAQPPFAAEAAGERDSSAGFIVTNPPYGKRLGDPAAAEQTYRDMAALRQRFPGWKLAVITDHPGFESFFGKKADSCREISNGAVPSYLYRYE
jgi:putative N6-adenine-specific DNA methylase